MGDVRQIDRRFLGDDPALLTRGLTLMAPDRVDARNERAIFRREDLEDFALLPLVAARRHDDPIAFSYLGGHQRTSGASEMIFMWFLARSSRVTGPKMRVPTGSPCGLTRTAAFESKRIRLPSGRRTPCAVRTTTAFRTSPFFTRPRGMASFTLTTIVSPTSA